MCAQAFAVLTSAKSEFVRQALISPGAVTFALETLFLEGGENGDQGGGGQVGRESRVAARCRLSGATALVAIFAGAEASQTIR